MSKKLIGATIIALLFSSVSFANVQGTSDADPVAASEMKLILLCDGHDGDSTHPTDAN